MADAQRVTVVLSKDQIAALKTAVRSGEYASTSEILREAIHDWRLKRALTSDELDHLGDLWDEGKASGPAMPLDFAELKLEARSRLEKPRKTGRNGC